jgi:hypothetical protein
VTCSSRLEQAGHVLPGTEVHLHRRCAHSELHPGQQSHKGGRACEAVVTHIHGDTVMHGVVACG